MPAQDGDRYNLQLGSSGMTFSVECVVSPSALQKGLSGRESLEEGCGMLFIFPSLKKQSMWMPDMAFSLDIVWLDETLSVSHIVYGAAPCKTRNDCPGYPSKYDAKYAIEMLAGGARNYGFTEGMSLKVLF